MDVTTPAPASQEQPSPLPACETPLPPPDDAAAPAVEEQPEPETRSLVESVKTLKRFGALCQQQADGNFRLAETASLYVEQFLGASDKSTRSRAVENLADEWLLWDEDSLSSPKSKAMVRMKERVNVLLRVNAVRVLFGDGRDVAKGNGTKDGRGKGKCGHPIPWGKLRELAPLAERDPADNVEVWHVLSETLADKGKDLVREIATSGMDRRDVVTAVRKLMADHYESRRVEALRVATENPDNQEAQRALQAAEKDLTRWADKVFLESAPPPAPAADDTAPEPQPETRPEPRAPELPRMGESGTPKDVAEVLADAINVNDEPDDCLQELLILLAKSEALSAKGKRACNAALVILTRADKPAPAPAPAVPLNGHAVAVA